MNRISRVFSIHNQNFFKNNALNWAQQFNEVVWLDSNTYPHLYAKFDAVLAVDALALLKTDTHQAFDALEAFRKQCNDWIFGYLSYDLKNATESLHSANPDRLHFADMFFFQPRKLLFIQGNRVTFSYLPSDKNAIEEDFQHILNTPSIVANVKTDSLQIASRLQKKEYMARVHKLLDHIQKGTVYEVNFCQEFYAEDAMLHPLYTYKRLNALSETPFSVYLKSGVQYLFCASPERYIKKEGTKIIAQPIKGTAKRSPDEREDKRLQTALENNAKERAENIMIVDLVRNDLAKIARKGSVLVEELCKVYPFKQLHQMTSTISCIAQNPEAPVAVIKATFPMGSMTGAPKISAMEIIEATEVTKRGIYSGAAGYFSPDNNFDFNVVIRSICYNAQKKYVSFSVGSAITARSLPEKEYEECLAKAAAMHRVLTALN